MNTVLETLRSTQDLRMADLIAILQIPSISSHPQHADDMKACADAFAKLLQRAGMTATMVHTTPGHPIVTGSWLHAPGRPTLLIYGHYDVQPVDPLELWESAPFSPCIHHERIFARGAADDKGQILMHIHAVEAILKTHGCLPLNVIFLIEGEEEISSPNLPPFLIAEKTRLQADLAIVSDTSMWAEGIPAITASLRGLVALEVKVTGPDRDLHSGSFGGAVANPVEILARMLATLKDDQGSIAIPEFYADVQNPSLSRRQDVANIPFDETAYCRAIGIQSSWGEAGFSILERIWLRPTIEINGMWGGYSGPGVKTVLPAQAFAKLSMRLVCNQTPEATAALVANHLRMVAPPGVTVEINKLPGGGLPWHLSLDLPAVGAARQALADSFGIQPVIIGEGASIPIVADFERILSLKTLLVGFCLPDAKPHSPNENLHLPSFHTGTESLVRMMYYLGYS
ncbi:MAG: dipeptidase [Magnetococcales bacterium]|nr:dipeptidase [Magnetococcales bacterium]